MKKTLRQEGVPFGARMVFRAQHIWFIFMAAALICTIPFAFVWSLIHESGGAFIEGITGVMEDRLAEVTRQREKLVRMYARA